MRLPLLSLHGRQCGSSSTNRITSREKSSSVVANKLMSRGKPRVSTVNITTEYPALFLSNKCLGYSIWETKYFSKSQFQTAHRGSSTFSSSLNGFPDKFNAPKFQITPLRQMLSNRFSLSRCSPYTNFPGKTHIRHHKRKQTPYEQELPHLPTILMIPKKANDECNGNKLV